MEVKNWRKSARRELKEEENCELSGGLVTLPSLLSFDK